MTSSALAIGAVHLPVLLAIAAFTFASILYLAHGAPSHPASALLTASVALFCLFQTVQWPLSWLSEIAPQNEEVWRESLALVAPPAPHAAPISIDPGATQHEALKWFFYSGLLFLTSWTVHRHGTYLVVAIVFCVSVAVGCVTLAHGIVGAERLYGIYERSFAGLPWALSPLVNSNNLAGTMNLGVISGLALLSRRRWDNEALSNSVWLCVATMAGLCLTSGSRGGVGTLLLGLAACATIHIFRHGTRRQMRLSQVALTGGGVLFAALFLAWTRPDENAFRGLEDDSLDKLKMIAWVAPLLRDHFWLGVGAGAFGTGFLPYQVLDDSEIWTHPENFLLGWAAEFGIPATLGIVCVLGLALYKRSQHRFRTHELMAWVAVGMWLLQNFVDLAATVPGAFAPVICLIGGLLQRKKEPDNQPISSTLVSPLIVGAAGTALCVFLFSYAQPSADEDRRSVSELARSTAQGEFPAEQFRREIAAAVRRHPGDAFLLRMGAFATARDEVDRSMALRWLGRSLDRNMVSGRTHLVLALELARVGALSQALMELRLSVERNPHLLPLAAQYAVAWTVDEKLLRKTVPSGPSGSPVLTELAQRLSPESNGPLRRTFLEEATRLDPENIRSRLIYLEDALKRLRAQPETCPLDCVRELRQQSEVLTRLVADEEAYEARVLELSAEVKALAGDPRRAVEDLLAGCPRSRPPCLRFALTLSDKYELPLEQPIEYYLAASCPEPETCISAHRTLANVYARKANWYGANVHARNAAAISNSAADYLLAARTALKADRPRLARQALDKLHSTTPSASTEELRTAQQLREKIPVDFRTPGAPGNARP